MLAKKNRIQTNKEFQLIFRRSKPFSVEHLVLRAMKTNKSQSRFGFVVSNKIDKRATRRNLLRRKLRAIAREQIAKISNGYDIVVIVRVNPDRPYNFELLKSEMVAGLKKAGVYHD